MTSTFRDAYAAACEESQTRPLAHVLEACEAAAGLESGAQLRCAGATPRLLDLDVQTIVRALVSGHSFAVLDFSHNHLGLDSARALASLLAEDKTIKMLDLTGNDIDEHGVVLLCRALRSNRTLTELRLGGNSVRHDGGMAVAQLLQENDTLAHLHLPNAMLDTENLVAISTVLHGNTSIVTLDVQRPLNLSLMEAVPDHFSRMLGVNRTLCDLDLSK